MVLRIWGFPVAWEFPKPREIPLTREFQRLKIFLPEKMELPAYGFALNIPDRDVQRKIPVPSHPYGFKVFPRMLEDP